MFLLSLLITLKPTDGLDVLAADVWQHGQKKCVLVGHKRVHLHDIRRPYVGAVHLKDLVPNVKEPLKHLLRPGVVHPRNEDPLMSVDTTSCKEEAEGASVRSSEFHNLGPIQVHLQKLAADMCGLAARPQGV